MRHARTAGFAILAALFVAVTGCASSKVIELPNGDKANCDYAATISGGEKLTKCTNLRTGEVTRY